MPELCSRETPHHGRAGYGLPPLHSRPWDSEWPSLTMNAFALLAPLQGRPCLSSVPFSLSQAPCSVWKAWLRNQTPSRSPLPTAPALASVPGHFLPGTGTGLPHLVFVFQCVRACVRVIVSVSVCTPQYGVYRGHRLIGRIVFPLHNVDPRD